VEDDVDVWRYTIVSCMPETTTTRVLSLCRSFPVIADNDLLETH